VPLSQKYFGGPLQKSIKLYAVAHPFGPLRLKPNGEGS
jgi:hypothetical protein